MLHNFLVFRSVYHQIFACYSSDQNYNAVARKLKLDFFLEIVQNLDIRYVVLSIASLLHKFVHVHFLGCNILLIFSTCCSDEFCQYKMTALTCFPTNGKMICILIFLLGFHISPCCNPCVYRYTCKDNIKIASSVFSHAIIAYV